MEKRLKARSWAGKPDIVTQLRREVRVGMLTGHISGVHIAARLGMSRRTLHRRLVDHGVTFQQISDETRCECARQLLAQTRLSIGRIGLVVCYRDPSVFTRAFIRWAGMTPSEWRLQITKSGKHVVSLKNG